MKNVRNQVQIVGRVGNDLELKLTQKEAKYCRFSIAYNDVYKNAKKETIVNTHWFTAIAWGDLAARLVDRVSKGDEVMICGKLQTHEYTTSEGEKRNSTDILMDQFLLTQKYVAQTAEQVA